MKYAELGRDVRAQHNTTSPNGPTTNQILAECDQIISQINSEIACIEERFQTALTLPNKGEAISPDEPQRYCSSINGEAENLMKRLHSVRGRLQTIYSNTDL